MDTDISVLKCVGSRIGSVMLIDYEEGGHKTQEEGIRKGASSKPKGKITGMSLKRSNYYPFFPPLTQIGLHSLLPLSRSLLYNLPTLPS